MSPTGAPDPRQNPARTAALTAVVGAAGGGRRAFIDGTGTPVPLPAAIHRLVATDDEVGSVLLGLGAPLVGCAGTLSDVATVGPARAPDLQAVAALRPDVIVTGVAGRQHDLADATLVDALRRVAPVVAVDISRPVVATADLRALLAPRART